MENASVSLKQQLRKTSKQIRSGIEEIDQAAASQLICNHIERWEVFQQAEVILTYLPFKGEVDLTSLLSDFPGKVWAAPRIKSDGLMDFHQYDPERLVRHSFGMLEPAPDCPTITPDQVQLALVPGLAYDRQGWRLGYGGGFYDRFLAHFQGVTAGITYQALLLDDIPHAGHDIPMQYVITETGPIIEVAPQKNR
jgi:5-formyltetrahydrofolate cyclo-ligase